MLELLVNLGVVIGTVGALWMLKRSFLRGIDKRITALTDYYADEKKDLVENIPALMNQLGDTLFQKVRGMVGGQASGEVRLSQGLQGALTEDLIKGQNPLLGALMDRMPSVKKFVTKNPSAIPQILDILGQLGGMTQQGQGGKPISQMQQRIAKGYKLG